MGIKQTFEFEPKTEINLNNTTKYKEITRFEATAKCLKTYVDGMITAIYQMNNDIKDRLKRNRTANVNLNDDPNDITLKKQENGDLRMDSQTKDVHGNKTQTAYLNNPLIIDQTLTSINSQTSRENWNVKKKESTLLIILKHLYLLWWLLPVIVLWFWILLYRQCKSSS